MKGIILAGGKGVRMHPYTEAVPKPMLEVAGKPILYWLVMQLKAAGIKEVVLMEGYLAHIIREYFDTSDDWGVKITHIIDKHPNQGMAELVKLAAASPNGEITDDALIMAGDTLIGVDYKELINFHKSKGAGVTVVGRRERLSHGIFTLNSNAQVTSVEEKPSVIMPTASMLVSRDILRNIDEKGDFFLNVAPYIEKDGYLFEVDADEVIHVSERRDDLAVANIRWKGLKQQA